MLTTSHAQKKQRSPFSRFKRGLKKRVINLLTWSPFAACSAAEQDETLHTNNFLQIANEPFNVPEVKTVTDITETESLPELETPVSTPHSMMNAFDEEIKGPIRRTPLTINFKVSPFKSNTQEEEPKLQDTIKVDHSTLYATGLTTMVASIGAAAYKWTSEAAAVKAAEELARVAAVKAAEELARAAAVKAAEELARVAAVKATEIIATAEAINVAVEGMRAGVARGVIETAKNAAANSLVGYLPAMCILGGSAMMYRYMTAIHPTKSQEEELRDKNPANQLTPSSVKNTYALLSA